MTREKIGKHLERTGNTFRLIGDLPEGAIDSHAHVGMYLRFPMLGGMNLTGPGSYSENLLYHLSQLWKYKEDFLKGLTGLSLSSMEGLLDVAAVKTDMEGPGPEPRHMFTAMESLFDRDAPCYLNPAPRFSLDLMGEILGVVKAFPGILKEANLANLVDYARTYGLSKVVPLPIESGRFSRFSEVFMQSSEGVDEVIPFFSVHPRNPGVEAQFRSLVARGGRGVKFHPEFQGVGPDSEEAFCLFELCDEASLPVVCHVGGVAEGAPHSHPDRYRAAVKRFPGLTFILCHVGLADRGATIALARECENTVLETSGQPVDGLREAATAVGTGRILFGSDWPLYHPAVPISCVLEAFPKDADREKVFRDNLLGLLKGQVSA